MEKNCRPLDDFALGLSWQQEQSLHSRQIHKAMQSVHASTVTSCFHIVSVGVFISHVFTGVGKSNILSNYNYAVAQGH